jgi:acetolactate synthase-1/2/3 large subunit
VDRVPVLVLGATGPVDRSKRRPYIDWIHTALVQGNAVRDYVKWDDQPASIDDFGGSFARGFRIATQEPSGPVYICYDAGLQEDELDGPISVAAEIAGARPTALQADPEALEHAAHLIAHAERPVIVTEYAGRHPVTFTEVRRLAELLGAPVIDLQGRLGMATRHPLNFSGGSDTVLADADLVLSIDVGDLSRALHRLDRTTHQKQARIPKGCTLIDIGLMELRSSKWSEDLGAFQPVDLAIVADTSLALPALRELVADDASATWPGRRSRVEKENQKLRADVQKKSREHWDDTPIWPARLASDVWDAIKGEDWVLTAGDLEDWAWKLWDIDSPVRWPGRALGTATQIGISIGVALAHRGDGKLIVDLQPDGDLLFDPGALWTAANLKLPMLLVMYNNRAYYNDWEHQLRVADKRGTDKAKAYIGMDLSDPAPDFAMLAKSFGWYSEGPVTDPKDIGPAVKRAIEAIKREGRPALVDTIVRRRELTRFR